MTNDVDFDALSIKATESGAMEDLNALFGAAFKLPAWHFIARGELPDVYPYVASNTAYADNQPMIRAFTDPQRLMRFAKENNLTRDDGSSETLSIPTAGIVEYLEGFTAQGAYGVWFNSDTASDGFFIPLKQLHPIKEHLAKLGAPENGGRNRAVATLQLIVTEALMTPSLVSVEVPYKINYFWRMPLDWVENGEIKKEYFSKIDDIILNPDRRSDRIPGGQYIIKDIRTKILTPETIETQNWGAMPQEDAHNIYYFCLASEAGAPRKVTVQEFQADVDAAAQIGGENADRARRSSALENWGLSDAPDGETDLNLNLNQVGAVDFETSIAPFYEAIAPLLEDYRGAGEYLTLLAFDPHGKSQLVENIAANAHGDYLQIRRFLYLNPKNNVRIGVNSIHSNRLRHVRTGASLLVSLELCKNLDNQTAALYFRFEGAKGEISKLAAAIQPILASARYKAVG